MSVHQIVGLPHPCDIRVQVVKTPGTNMCVRFQDRYTVEIKMPNAKETIITSAYVVFVFFSSSSLGVPVFFALQGNGGRGSLLNGVLRWPVSPC